jgi:hypothetical protein
VGDVNLSVWTIERIAAGEPYYAAVGDELRRHRYPTKSVFNWRTPFHYTTVATLSVERTGKVLFGLACAVILTGAFAYTQFSAVNSVIAPILLLGAMLPALLVRPGGVALPEISAGVIIGLSLNAYVARQCVAGAVLGVLAVFVREIAAPYFLVCGLLALLARRRSELMVCLVGGLAYAVYYAFHAMAASAAMQPGDLAHAQSWVQWPGLPFVLKTLHTYGWLTLLPPPVTAVAVSLGMAGAFARSISPQARWSLVCYLAFFSIVGQSFNYYWGYLVCAIWAHAFLHSVEGLSALVRTAQADPEATPEAVAS